MKRERHRVGSPFVAAVVLSAVVVSCGGGESGESTTSTAPVTTAPTTGAPATTLPVRTPAPTTTSAPTMTTATTTAAPTTTASPTTSTAPDPNAPFRDDFESELDSSWSWLNEDPQRWAIEDGRLVLTAADRGVHEGAGDGVNVLTRPTPAGVDIAVTASVSASPDEDYEMTGVALVADADTYVNLVLAFCDVCGGRGIYLEVFVGGETIGEEMLGDALGPDVTEVRLRLEHSPGASATVPVVAFGRDGEWQSFGRVVRDIAAFESVALHAANQPGPDSSDAEDLVARYDWFEIEVFD